MSGVRTLLAGSHKFAVTGVCLTEAVRTNVTLRLLALLQRYSNCFTSQRFISENR